MRDFKNVIARWEEICEGMTICSSFSRGTLTRSQDLLGGGGSEMTDNSVRTMAGEFLACLCDVGAELAIRNLAFSLLCKHSPPSRSRHNLSSSSHGLFCCGDQFPDLQTSTDSQVGKGREEKRDIESAHLLFDLWCQAKKEYCLHIVVRKLEMEAVVNLRPHSEEVARLDLCTGCAGRMVLSTGCPLLLVITSWAPGGKDGESREGKLHPSTVVPAPFPLLLCHQIILPHLESVSLL